MAALRQQQSGRQHRQHQKQQQRPLRRQYTSNNNNNNSPHNNPQGSGQVKKVVVVVGQKLHRQPHRLSVGHRIKNDILMAAFVVVCCCLSRGGVLCAPAPGQQQQTATADTGKSPLAGSGEVMQPMRDSNWLKGYEPSCDELRAMWRFSKRQSRAAEITNEIPTYRGDPFTMNMWPASKPITSKQNGGMTLKGRNLNRYKYDRAGNPMRGAARNSLGLPQFLGPVYGRVLHKEPEEFGYPVQPQQQMPRRIQYRFPGLGPSPNGSPNLPTNAVLSRMSGGTPLNATPQRGSFMKLKELVWTERARELAQQRRNEEMLARAAVLKELANGGHGLSYQIGNQDGYYSSSSGGGNGGGGLDYNMENGGGGDDESSYYDSAMGSVPKLSHFRERNSFLQQQQQQQQPQQSPQQQANSNSKINFPSKHGRMY